MLSLLGYDKNQIIQKQDPEFGFRFSGTRYGFSNFCSDMKELDLACSNSGSSQKNQNEVTQILVQNGSNQNLTENHFKLG